MNGKDQRARFFYSAHNNIKSTTLQTKRLLGKLISVVSPMY